MQSPSRTRLRRKWREALVTVLLLGAGLLFHFGRHPSIIFSATATWIAAVVVYGYLLGMASKIYRGALYVYASEGVVPEPYTAELLDAAWKVGKK